MLSLKHLRIFLILNILALIIDTILVVYYDPTISPLLSQAAQIQKDVVISNGLGAAFFFLMYTLLEIFALTYSTIALWIGHQSGKWMFIIYLILGCTDYYFAKIIAISWLSACVVNLSMIFSGVILAIAFSGASTPVKRTNN